MAVDEDNERLSRPDDVLRDDAALSGPLSGTAVQLHALINDLSRIIEQVGTQMAASQPTDFPQVLEAHRDAVRRVMIELGTGMAAFGATVQREADYRLVQSLVLEPIRRWAATSRLYESAIRWQQSAAWFSDLRDLLLSSDSAGATVSAMVMNDYFRHSVAAQSFGNRVNLLVKLLRMEVAQRVEAGIVPVRLLSYGNGAGSELALAAQERAFAAVARVTFVDDSPDALRDAKRRVSGHLREPATYLLATPLRLTGNSNRPPRPFHIIHTLARLDQLSDADATTALWECCDLLEPGGVLIVGSIGKGVPVGERALIEALFDANLTYRDEADYRRLLAHTPFGGANLRVDTESLAAAMVVRVQVTSPL